MRTPVNVTVFALTSVVLSGCASLLKPVTTQSLLSEMTDLKGMAEFPSPAYTCRQFSSYDRKSTSAEDHETWFANADCGKYLRVEETPILGEDGEPAMRNEHVMMDTDGPGAIVRVWSANPKGTLRIYLDHSETPVIEAPMKELLGGESDGIPKPIAGERSHGWNSYFPIPYARHCKVTSDEGGFYYHVNYRTYPWSTRVVSFTPDDLGECAADIKDVAKRLEERAPQSPSGEGWGTNAHESSVTLPGGGTERWVAEGDGSGAIVAFAARVEADDMDAALRQVLLTMDFDGDKTVSCPLGDFFGAAPGLNPYNSLPLGVDEDGGMWSRWVMPFRKSAEVCFHNMGEQPVSINYEIETDYYRWTHRSMHFHAKWRTEFDVPTRPMQDWNYLTAKGKGVFAGVAFAVANPVRNWWGEGDEKIYVDGETFPSHFGTGTEDYYGYAWCCPEPFTHAYHNQPRCDGPGNYGHTAVNRWHVIDRIPFKKDFKFDMELWHWKDDIEVDMSVAAYWYARPGGGDGFEPIEPSDLIVTILPEYVPPRVEGAIEGEEMRVIEATGGTHEPQTISGCSNDAHLWWRDGKPGDRLVLGFEVPATGKYKVFARLLKARDYGVAQLSINGQQTEMAVDLYNPNIKVSKEFELGVFELTEGENHISAEIVGINPEAIERCMFGLDYVRLEAAE